MNKENLLQLVKNKIAEKISNLEAMISDKRDSNNDTKSSMGDKYETGREMLQQEINNLQNQLKGFTDQEFLLKSIKTETTQKVEKGAVVKTNKGVFYISASVGELNVDGQKIIAISEESPLAKTMKGKLKGDKFSINNLKQTIQDVW